MTENGFTKLAQEMTDDETFRASFDRNSATFHGGLAIPVPIGGMLFEMIYF